MSSCAAPPNLTASSCNLTHFRYPLFRTTYSLVLMMGLPLNVMALWMFVHHLGLRRSMPVVYMTNLALSDLLFVLSLPLRITYFTLGRWTLGDVACMIPGTMFTVNLYSSSLFIMLISIDRMLAVVYPLRSRSLRTVPVAWISSAAVWLAIGALAVPVAFNHRATKDQTCNVSRCFEHYSHENWRFGFTILCVITALGIVLPFSVILVCTAAVVRQLRGVQVPSHSQAGMNKDKMVWLFMSNLLIYAVCFIPFHVAFILYGLYKLNFLCYNFFDVHTVTMCLASTNSCLDPFIYYFSAKSMQRKGSVKSKDDREQASSPTYFSVSLRGLLQ